MSTIIVPPDGPLSARIAVIGQNLGKTEINPHVLSPFQGYSGNLLRKWWSKLSPPLHREDIYLDNLIPYMCDPEALPENELQYWERQLHMRLSKLPNLTVIVPVGNYSCYALIHKGLVKGASKKDKIGITSLRGSIYEYTSLTRRTCKVIPTLHPSALFQRDNSGRMGVTKGILEKRVFRDWERIAYESTFPEIREPKRSYFISPMESDVSRFTNEIEEAGSSVAVSIDIETPNGSIDCVGFSIDPSWAMVVPTITNQERDTFFPYIKRICESQAQKVLQNGLFDTYWLRNYGVDTCNYLWDLMYMHVVADPVNNHSLDFLSSIYLPYHRYWKDHAKADDGPFKWSESREDLLVYNGMDACISRELLGYLQQDLIDRGVWDYYCSNVQPLFIPLLDIALNGIAVDVPALRRLRADSIGKAETIRERLKTLAGEDLVPKTGLSPIKLKNFFHETLKLPKQYKITKKKDGKSKSVSLDAVNLAKLAHRYKAAHEPAQLVVEYRAEMKAQESWLNPDKLDADNYVRAQYRPVTEACRLASSAHPMGRAVKSFGVKKGKVSKGEWYHQGSEELSGVDVEEARKRKCKCDPKVKKEYDYFKVNIIPPKVKEVDRGYNLQNTKKELREIYIPDKECLLLEIDQSQIEDRMCKMYTGAARMVELANRHPSVFDVHTHNGALVFGIREEEVNKRQRFLGKVVSHGAERGMTGSKLSDKLLADYDLLISPDECQGMIDKFLEENWEIRDVFFPWVRNEIMRCGRLVNSWGAVWDVKDENLDDDLYRRGYSFPMQCCDDKTEVLTTKGFVPFPELGEYHLVAQWNKDDESITFAKPRKIFNYGYKGEMCSFESVRVSSCVTPNHKIVRYDPNIKHYKVHEAHELMNYCSVSIPVSGINTKKDSVSVTDNQIRLIAAIQADGHFKEQRIEWHFTKERKVERLVSLLEIEGLKYNKYYAECNKSYYITTKRTPLNEYINTYIPNKIFNWNVLNLGHRQRVALLEELRYWDGSQARPELKSFWYDSTIKQNSDVIQAIAIISGYRAYQSLLSKKEERHNAVHRVYVHKTRRASVSTKEVIDYQGKVYCLETETGFFVTRRNGKVSITGNSEAACWMFQWGLLPVHNYLKANWYRIHSRINIPRHDALIMSVPFEHVYEVCAFTLGTLERPRLIFGNWLTVPSTVKVGRNDAKGMEWKTLPSRKDFMDQLEEYLSQGGSTQ